MMPTINKDGKSIENVMLDLEPVGTSAGCGILCIGAATFDGKEKFYERISPESSRMYLREDIETLRWWNSQDRQLKEEAFGGTKELVVVLDEFYDWFRSLNGKDYKQTFVWGNGADFDLPILQWAIFVLTGQSLGTAGTAAVIGHSRTCFLTSRPHQGPARSTTHWTMQSIKQNMPSFF